MARTPGQIEAGALRCANALFARGVAPGDAIGVCLAEGDARAAALRACATLHSPPVCLAPESDAHALRASLERAHATALVHERGAAARVAAARRGLPRLRVVLSVDDGSGADLSGAGSEDFDSALAGAAPTLALPT